MKSRPYRPSIFMTYLTLIIFVLGQLTACSSSSTDGSGTVAEEPAEAAVRTSAATRYPGQFLTISDAGMNAGEIFSVQLSDGGEYNLTVKATCAVDGSIRIQVPPYLSGGDVTDGDVQVSVYGLDGTVPLHINDTIAISYEDDERPGDILRWWLNETLENYRQVRDDFGGFETDVAEIMGQIHNEIERLQAAVDEFDATGTMTLYFKDGSSHVLTESNLRTADEMLFLKAAGSMQAYEADRGALARSGQGWLDDVLNNPDLPVTQREVLEGLRRFKDETIPNVLDRIDAGSDLFAAFVSSEAALGVLYFGGAISGGWALAIGGLAALGYAGITGLHSEGLQWFQSRLNGALGDLSADDYEFGGEWLEHAVEAAESFAVNLGSGASEAYGELANNVWNAWSAIEAEVNLYCATRESQTISLSGGAYRTALEVEADVCENLESEVIDSVSMQGPASLSSNQSGTYTITILNGKPAFKIDVDWGDGLEETFFTTGRNPSVDHVFDADGSYSVTTTVTDIAGSSAAAQTTVSVGNAASETSVTFQDMWGYYTFTLTFPEGQADGYSVVIDTDVYNTDELVEVRLPSYPADSYMWPTTTVPVQIEVSGPEYDNWILYRNPSKSDWTRRVLLTYATSETLNIGSQYYFIDVHPESGPYRTIAFRLVGTVE